ncbi:MULTISPECIES: ribonuclease P protein component [Microbacterium]|uniref:ribonuclease P protein component n=1 Tax=Microbacterium TaxID=33882 RepID=UPI00165745A2|nr:MULTISPECIES: ribonuclease P protein component [Microbacterium]MCT1365928.1 ribonuclease P protein component [Microbacterium sp. p3-SID131]MCT1377967.1 ribonuclease P protein component [Microbacterium sp. p3-SID337]MCZ0711555.1 ribonuclease P protein component [Microbacterium paraoxydans]MDH5132940.1 ribonuclease P protein component [Microbacterium sp. RD10]MDH5136062.1 ribonuclease P protein component [Microbacterium sp. RD11]
MLARPFRLTRGSDYRLVVRRGSRCGGARVLTSMLATGESRAARFGFIISKQVGTAVVRNTVRRRLKAVCAEALPRVPQGTDVVIRALPASATASYAELRSDVHRCLARLAPAEAAS